MNTCQIIWGFLFSTIGGAIILWLLIGWPMKSRIDKLNAENNGNLLEPPGITLCLLGIMERGLYTAALLLNVPQWIALWLGIKTALKWKSYTGPRQLHDLSLIGTGLSVLFGVLGAWIALGRVPCF